MKTFLLTALARRGSLGLVAIATIALTGCTMYQQPSAALGPRGTDIINHPERHVGESVTVRGKVNNVYSRGSFTVGPEGFETDLRVLARGPASSVPRLREGDPVRVSGVVRIFLRRNFVTGYPTGFYGTGAGFYGLGPRYPLTSSFYGLRHGYYPNYYTTWERRPVIIAHEVTRLP